MTRDADQQSISGWDECPRGEIVRLVARLKSQRRRETITQAAVASASLTVLLIVGVFVAPGWFQSREPTFGGVTCSDVRAHAAAYLAGTLDEDTKQRIDYHVSCCFACRQYLHELRAGAIHAGIALGNGIVFGKANDAFAVGTEPVGVAGPQAAPTYRHCED